eukprot:3444975-Pleurochrysis_carterae.AAC.1
MCGMRPQRLERASHSDAPILSNGDFEYELACESALLLRVLSLEHANFVTMTQHSRARRHLSA